MSNITLFDNFAIAPNDLPKSAAASLLDNVSSNFRRISIKGNVFRYVVGGKEIGVCEDRHLDVVFVNAAPHYSRTFYAGAYEDDKATAPTCWSKDGNAPDSECKTKQHSACATCPQNIKGSGANGESRACRYSQRVAVVLANDIAGEVFALTLPATSIWGEATAKGFPLAGFSEQLKARNIDPGHIVTRMSFDISSATPKLLFAPQRYLESADVLAAIKQGTTEAAKAAITMTVAQIDKVEETEKPKAAAMPAPTAKPAAKTAEPVVRETKADKLPPKGNLADLVAQWGATDD